MAYRIKNAATLTIVIVRNVVFVWTVLERGKCLFILKVGAFGFRAFIHILN